MHRYVMFDAMYTTTSIGAKSKYKKNFKKIKTIPYLIS